jgi:hypothetical protein
MDNTHIDIKELFKRLNIVVEEFDEKIKRLETITKLEATDYHVVLESINNFKLLQEK